MDIESNLSITKLDINGQSVYVTYFWEQLEKYLFSIKIYDGENSWTGRCSSEFANILGESIDDYGMNVKIALSGTSSDYIFQFETLPDNKAKFSWIKVFDDSTRMPYGFVDLQLDNVAEPKNSLIDFLLSVNKELRNIIEMTNRRNVALTENLDRCKIQLEEFVNMKTSLESSLYGKFVQLLNEKKKRIKLLEDHIQHFE
jgi:DNA-repair protein XRCC4